MRKAWIATLPALIAVAAPAGGQLLGGRGPTGALTDALGRGGVGAPALVGGLAAPLAGIGETMRSLAPADLLAQRRARLGDLLRRNRATLEDDGAGNPVRRGEVLAIGPSAAAIAAAKAAGYVVTAHDAVDGLGVAVTILTPPGDKPARKALAELRALDPVGNYALDPIYEPARAPLAPAAGPVAPASAAGRAATIGLIDGGVGSHPAFAGAAIEQRGFAGDPKPSGHGTAVASLVVGKAGNFHGVLPGGALLVADVYGGSAGNGSAIALVRAMAWLATKGVRVINISLVGPPNPLLEAGVRALQARGIAVVAAVGNDGPAAPPQYPASYTGVVAVTGIDARGRPLIEAGRALHLDYAAPGADMAGAVPGGGWEVLRGTSFAAPLVAARLAEAGSVAALAAEARPGGDKMGRGIVCGDCRIPPRAVGLK